MSCFRPGGIAGLLPAGSKFQVLTLASDGITPVWSSTLSDSSGNTSVDFFNRVLQQSGGNKFLNWQNGNMNIGNGLQVEFDNTNTAGTANNFVMSWPNASTGKHIFRFFGGNQTDMIMIDTQNSAGRVDNNTSLISNRANWSALKTDGGVNATKRGFGVDFTSLGIVFMATDNFTNIIQLTAGSGISLLPKNGLVELFGINLSTSPKLSNGAGNSLALNNNNAGAKFVASSDQSGGTGATFALGKYQNIDIGNGIVIQVLKSDASA